jgi:hypothetical protein
MGKPNLDKPLCKFVTGQAEPNNILIAAEITFNLNNIACPDFRNWLVCFFKRLNEYLQNPYEY